MILARYLLYLATGVIAFSVCYTAGNRGLFAFDQSFVIDTAYRIYRGQLPYRDFYAPFGLTAFYGTALFYKLLGVHWSSVVIAASFASLIISWLQISLIASSGERSLWRQAIVGLVSAVCTLSVFGTVYAEYIACLFGLAALRVLFPSVPAPQYGIRILISGLCFGLAFHAKQNVALAFLPVLTGAAFFLQYPNKTIRSSVTFLTATVIFTVLPMLYFSASGLLETYFTYAYTIPSTLGRERLTENIDTLLILVPTLLLGTVFYIIRYHKAASNVPLEVQNEGIRRILLLFHCLFFPCVLELTMVQDPFVRHMLLGLLIVLIPRYFTKLLLLAGYTFHPALGRATLILTALACVGLGTYQSIWRGAQEPIAGSAFSAPLRDSFFDTLRWGEPTYSAQDKNIQIEHKDIRNALTRIRAEPGSVFIYPDFSILYTAAGKLPPHPYLWFHPGLSFKDMHELDSTLLNALILKQVKLIVLEASFFKLNEPRSLDLCPKTWNYVQTNFELVAAEGIFNFYQKKETIH